MSRRRSPVIRLHGAPTISAYYNYRKSFFEKPAQDSHFLTVPCAACDQEQTENLEPSVIDHEIKNFNGQFLKRSGSKILHMMPRPRQERSQSLGEIDIRRRVLAPGFTLTTAVHKPKSSIPIKSSVIENGIKMEHRWFDRRQSSEDSLASTSTSTGSDSVCSSEQSNSSAYEDFLVNREVESKLHISAQLFDAMKIRPSNSLESLALDLSVTPPHDLSDDSFEMADL